MRIHCKSRFAQVLCTPAVQILLERFSKQGQIILRQLTNRSAIEIVQIPAPVAKLLKGPLPSLVAVPE
jgi:hypothetical protein